MKSVRRRHGISHRIRDHHPIDKDKCTIFGGVWSRNEATKTSQGFAHRRTRLGKYPPIDSIAVSFVLCAFRINTSQQMLKQSRPLSACFILIKTKEIDDVSCLSFLN
ncbi:MAG TPA: hypothetical protein DDZ88_27620 [Verrucomicrobiales bacterium]|nr:hypothetical protein [Verrucomicrobiales bacterium]